MTDTKILLNDIPNFGYFLVPFYFTFGQLCRGCILSHDSVGDIIHGQKIAIRKAGITFIGKYFFNGLFGMFAEDCTVSKKISVISRSRRNRSKIKSDVGGAPLLCPYCP